MQQQVKSISELESVAKELVFHSGEVFSRIFIPAIILGKREDVIYHAKELKKGLEKVV